MRDGLSFKKRTDDFEMNAIACEMERLVKHAAEPIAAGESIKAQMRRAWEALGRPTWWRFRAAWYREAGAWPAYVVDDFRTRAAARHRKQEEVRARERTNAASVLADLRQHYAASDPELYREQIAAIDAALGTSRGDTPSVG